MEVRCLEGLSDSRAFGASLYREWEECSPESHIRWEAEGRQPGTGDALMIAWEAKPGRAHSQVCPWQKHTQMATEIHTPARS